MKSNWKRISLGVLATIVALAGVLTISSMAFAQGPGGKGHDGGGRGRGGNECSGLVGRWHDSDNSLVTVSAEVLGMERLDLIAELLDGKTIAQVAEEQGVDPQAIVDAFVAIRAELLAEAVEATCITQDQADQMLADLRAEVAARLDEPLSPWGGDWCW